MAIDLNDMRWEKGWTPCPMDQPCGNCDHPLRGHWGINPVGFQTKCNECPCEIWYCRHGGMPT